MKINEGQGPLLPPKARTGPKKGSDVNDFQKIMNQTNSRIDHRSGVAGKEIPDSIPGGVQILQGTSRSGGPDNIPDKKQLLKDLKETLDVVDFYAQKLGDASLSANGLTPLIGHLEDRLGMLNEMASSPHTPENMKPVVSDMVITIGTEIAKFRRGDYV